MTPCQTNLVKSTTVVKQIHNITSEALLHEKDKKIKTSQHQERGIRCSRCQKHGELQRKKLAITKKNIYAKLTQYEVIYPIVKCQGRFSNQLYIISAQLLQITFENISFYVKRLKNFVKIPKLPIG